MAGQSSIQEYRELADEALQAKVKELEGALLNMKFQLSMGKLENTAQIRSTRQRIAQAKTVLTEKANKAKA